MKDIFFVIREKGNIFVSVMFNRMDNKYYFVNLKKGHICICGFSSVEDAINDLKRLKEAGDIIDCYKIDEKGDKII